MVLVPIHPDAEGDHGHRLVATMPTSANGSADIAVKIHTLPEADKNGLIIKIEPPIAPEDASLSHVPCDIALVIDVSGSMGVDAPVPGESTERTGLSVLDLVKHSCRTIMSTLDESDRLAILTFSSGSKILQPLTPMTPENKKASEEKIKQMSLESCTNLWHGLRDGIKLFQDENDTGRVPAVMVLTDGAPNHMCPAQGYVPALKALGEIVPSIHTFGFGYSLRSGLLQSIAEFGGGNYSFIPDAGMIGTVFVHAVAHLQSTFAMYASLQLTYPRHSELQQMAGQTVAQEEHAREVGDEHQLTILLGNIQYGQSRDVYLHWENSCNYKDTMYIEAALHYKQVREIQRTRTAECSLLDTQYALPAAEIAYHISRHQICAFLSALFPIDALGEHRINIKDPRSPPSSSGVTIEHLQEQLKHLIASLPAAKFPNHPGCASLLQDLAGAEPAGQVSIALSRQDFLHRWGQHYLPSLLGAHARQLCNSFKDPGPLQYGVHSPLFTSCRDRLSSAFDDLPAPEPSNAPLPPPRPRRRQLTHVGGDWDGGDELRSSAMRSGAKPVSMSVYNRSGNPCFAADTPVALAEDNEGTRLPISLLERGMSVETPRGSRRVSAVLVTPVRDATMVKLRGVLVTPWHPVASCAEGDKVRGWAFPCQLEQDDVELVAYTGDIYSVLLEREEDSDAHAVMLGDAQDGPFWGVTLGHGILTGSDARAHEFFGSYDSVARGLAGLGTAQGGRFWSAGVERSKETGLACGFEPDRQPRSDLLKTPSNVLTDILCSNT